MSDSDLTVKVDNAVETRPKAERARCVIKALYPKQCPYTDNTKCSLCWWLK